MPRVCSDWRVSDCQHQVLLSVLPRYGLALKLKTASSFAASHAARPRDVAARSRPQAKKCQLAKFSMPWRGSHRWVCSRWEHAIPRGLPPQLGDPRGSRQRLPLLCVSDIRPPAGGLLHRRNPLSEVGHVLCRRTFVRLDETGWSQKERKEAHSRRALLVRSVPRNGRLPKQPGQPGRARVSSLSFFAWFFFLFCSCGRADRRRPMRHCRASCPARVSVSRTRLIFDTTGGRVYSPLYCVTGRPFCEWQPFYDLG